MAVDPFPAATFAGGCFWCLEADLRHVPGVFAAMPGYTGGQTPNPGYEEVCQGHTGHYEAVQFRFDPGLVDYRALVDWFWRRIDPCNANGQFCDHGPQYLPAIFFHDAAQRRDARDSMAALAALGLLPGPNVTALLPAGPFHPAEAFHQEYSRKEPRRYQQYRLGCGRDATLERLWGPEAADPLLGYVPRLPKGAPPDDVLRARLSPLAYRVTREQGTEPPFDNAYWNEHRDGLYVDPVSGAPLFSSRDKFDSGTGWPSFARPLMPGNLATRRDTSLLSPRTEVLAWHSGNHLGHVFPDGPRELGGMRYCMNSASLRFIPLAELEQEGYGRYAGLFSPR